MGWYGSTKKYGETTKEFLLREYNSEKYPIIEIAIKNFTTAYILMQNKETEEIFACVYLLRYERDDCNRKEIMVKTMDEFCHPYYYDIPEKMFWKLTPTMNDAGGRLHWRQEVLKRIEKKREIKKMKIGQGSVIRFKESIHFTDGFENDTFKIDKMFKKFVFRNFNSSIGYRISNWRKREFEILSSQDYEDMRCASMKKVVEEFA